MYGLNVEIHTQVIFHSWRNSIAEIYRKSFNFAKLVIWNIYGSIKIRSGYSI